MAPKFQKRHYEVVGTVLGQARAPKYEVQMFASEFKKDNPQFSESRFTEHVDRNRPNYNRVRVTLKKKKAGR